MNRADSIRIDTDEGRFVMIIEAEDADHRFDIHDIALAVEACVRRELRPYALEAEHARATMPTDEQADPYGGRTPFPHPNESGYDLDDPKHPTWLERVHAAADMERGGRCV